MVGEAQVFMEMLFLIRAKLIMYCHKMYLWFIFTQDGPFSATMKTTFSEFYFAIISPKISIKRQRYFNSINIPGIKKHNVFPLEPTV